MHQKNIESLDIEIYKFQEALTLPIMSELFATRVKNIILEVFKHNNLHTTNSNVWNKIYFL